MTEGNAYGTVAAAQARRRRGYSLHTLVSTALAGRQARCLGL